MDHRMRLDALADLRRLIDMAGQGDGHIVLLNDYHVANLRGAFEAAGYNYAGEPKDSPLDVLNTGDWLGEIYQRLPNHILVPSNPNVEPGELRRRALSWKSWR